jgi:hypothetical protein
MFLKNHVIISALVFGFLYYQGFPLDFVVLAFGASVLIDIDHLTLGKAFGTYNPIGIYESCVSRKLEKMYTPREIFVRKWLDFKVMPLHNIFLNVILLITILPVGIGVLLHNVLDMIDYLVASSLGLEIPM